MMIKTLLILKQNRVTQALFIAGLLIAVVFADVWINGTSLRISDPYSQVLLKPEGNPIFPVPSHTSWWSQYSDSGGTIYQSEPMIEFMRHSFSTGQSPYWNPYSSGGSLGPETLVDQKFSTFTILHALIGKGAKTYNWILLTIYFFALFFLYRTLREFIGLSPLASTTGLLFYLLNGYSAANTSSNVTQSYLYIPMCIFFSSSFMKRSNSLNFIGCVISFILLLSCSFLPTTFMSMVAIYAVFIGISISMMISSNKSARLYCLKLGLHFCSVLFALGCLAVLYFPIAENIHSMGTLEAYAKRTFTTLLFPEALTALFSPSLFFESYNAMEKSAALWKGRSVLGNTVYHLGLVAIILTTISFNIRDKKNQIVSYFCLTAIGIAAFRLFGLPVYSDIFNAIPVVGSMASQYLWPVVIIPMTFLVGIGFKALELKTFQIWPTTLVLIAGVAGIIAIALEYGLKEPHLNFKIKMLVLLLISTVLLVFGLYSTLKKQKTTNRWLYFFFFMMFIELIYNGKAVRVPPTEVFKNPDSAIVYIKNNLGDYRTLNLGPFGLYPELGSAFQINEISSMNQGVFPKYLDKFHQLVKFERQFTGFPSTIRMEDSPSTSTINWKDLSKFGLKFVIVSNTYPNYKKTLKDSNFLNVFENNNVTIFENPNLFPRAFVVPMEETEKNLDIDLFKLEPEKINTAKISTFRNTEVELTGNSPSSGILVLTDNWHKNWSSKLNGQSVPTLKINEIFRGVQVPKGPFQVKMHYQPKSLYIASRISLFLAFTLLLGLIFNRKIDLLIKKTFKISATN